jgi:hypothetical protein
MNKKSKLGSLAWCMALALVLVGCSSIHPWNLEISKKTPASIQVDLVGVASPNEENFLTSVSFEDYWNNPQFRNDQVKLGNMLTKFPEQGHPWILKATDPQWQAWLQRGVNEVYVVARLPEANGNWKVPLPLGKKNWDAKKKTIEISVVDSAIIVETRQIH